MAKIVFSSPGAEQCEMDGGEVPDGFLERFLLIPEINLATSILQGLGENSEGLGFVGGARGLLNPFAVQLELEPVDTGAVSSIERGHRGILAIWRTPILPSWLPLFMAASRFVRFHLAGEAGWSGASPSLDAESVYWRSVGACGASDTSDR